MISALHTIDSIDLSKGGPAYSVPHLCRTLRDCGVRVRLETRALVSESQQQHLGSNDVILGERTLGQATQNSPTGPRIDLIHNHGLWLAINRLATRSSRRLQIPLILSPRGMLEPRAMRHRAYKKRIAWWLYQRSDVRAATVLHATCESEAEGFRRLGFRQPIAIVPNGVELRSLADPPAARDERIALFLSRIHPIKGLLNLVAAWNEVRPEGWSCVIAGMEEDGHEAAVKRAVHRAGLRERFRFVGPAVGEEKWQLFRSANLFVLPTFSENFGVVVAEALASQVPVITTKGAPWNCLESHRCGWWVDIGVEPLAAALQTATSLSDAQRAELGARGRELVSQRFGWKQIGDQMKDVYAWMLGGGPPPNCLLTN